jgi:glycosyltransferase involved in cell wall biosynthesis
VADAIITTIIPTFRRPKLLRRAIDSVLQQSFKDFKIAVHDNASEDETEQVVAEYSRHDSRIFYSKNSSNIGAANNIIQGVNAVTTDFYSILNDDDFLLPHFYENAFSAFQKYPNAEFVCAKTITVDLINKKWRFRNKEWNEGFYEPSTAIAAKMHGSYFTQTGVLLRRGMREKIGPFEKSADDMLYMVLAAASSPFSVLDDYGAVFLIHPKAYSIVTGLRQDNTVSVYDAFLSTVSQVMRLDMPADRKAYLLMLVIKIYGASFDNRRIRQHMTNSAAMDVEEATAMPSTITVAALASALYERTSKGWHPILTALFKPVQAAKRAVVSIRERNTWAALPDEAYHFCNSDGEDSSILLPIIHSAQQNQKTQR